MKTNIISHRGANFFAPQNTLPAFKKSLEFGVDGFETDVHLTKDGVPVLCHNYTINATSNKKGNITDYTYAELQAFDFGKYFSPAYKGTQIPTVEDFLALVAVSDISILNIELKSPKDKTESTIVTKTVDLAKRFGLMDKLLISSFDPDLLIEAKKYAPECKTGLLYSPNYRIAWKIARDPVSFALSIGADALHPHQIYVTKRYVEAAHESNLMVNPWTVDTPKNIEKMLNWNVDGIITNHPDLVKHLIEVREKAL